MQDGKQSDDNKPVECNDGFNEKLLTNIRATVPEKFPGYKILDLTDPLTQEQITSLERVAYINSGYGDNIEGDNHFSRINEYSQENSLALGLFDKEGKSLLYYINFTILSPSETVFLEDQDLYDQETEQFLKLPGLVFNKILKLPGFVDPEKTATKIEFFLIQQLLETSNMDIRIEEQCQPDSYRFFKTAERRNRVQIPKDILVQNKTGVDVHKILAIVYNESNLQFLRGING